MKTQKLKNGIRLIGRISPDVHIKEFCLCGKEDCIRQSNGVDVVFEVIAHIKPEDLPNLIEHLSHVAVGWSDDENKAWILELKEIKKTFKE